MYIDAAPEASPPGGRAPTGHLSATVLRRHFAVPDDGFAAILVGKDGTEKLRSDTPVTPVTLFAAIDAMPMRQQELRDRQNDGG